MESYEDLYKTICRVCLSYGKSENMVCLFDKNSEDGLSCYGKAVGMFANIFINNKDELPENMCQNCLSILKNAIYFKLKCESSDRQLSRLFKLNKKSQSNFKETVVDYLMYNHYLPQDPQESITSNSGKPVKIKSENQYSEKPEKHNVDQDYSCFDNDLSNDNDLENFDIDPDKELDILEKMVTQSSCITSKSDYKPLKNRKTSQRKNVVQKSSITQSKIRQKLLKKQNSFTEKCSKKLVCPVCNKELANPNTYRYHMERHNGCKFICEHCGKGYPVLCELQMHQVSRHGTGPYLQCPHCSYKAPRKLNLVEHIRLHTGERPYTCDKCGLTFRRSAIWKKHMVYHSEKTVQCPHCPKKFYRLGEMQSHANSIHERVYVYACHKCDATYAKSGSVRRHLAEKHGVPRDQQGRVARVNRAEGCL